MTPTAYLFFNGNCAAAMEAYANILQGEILEQMPATELPPEIPMQEDRRDWILHARMKIGEGEVMMSDDIFADSAPMAGCAISLNYPTVDQAKSVFDRLADGGHVQMAWDATFWSAGFGMLTDRFGVKWMIGTDAAPSAG